MSGRAWRACSSHQPDNSTVHPLYWMAHCRTVFYHCVNPPCGHDSPTGSICVIISVSYVVFVCHVMLWTFPLRRVRAEHSSCHHITICTSCHRSGHHHLSTSRSLNHPTHLTSPRRQRQARGVPISIATKAPASNPHASIIPVAMLCRATGLHIDWSADPTISSSSPPAPHPGFSCCSTGPGHVIVARSPPDPHSVFFCCCDFAIWSSSRTPASGTSIGAYELSRHRFSPSFIAASWFAVAAPGRCAERPARHSPTMPSPWVDVITLFGQRLSGQPSSIR